VRPKNSRKPVDYRIGDWTVPVTARIGTRSYRHHTPSNQAVVTLDGRDIYLGRYNSDESRAEYDRFIVP
jgi:hypothetical protein